MSFDIEELKRRLPFREVAAKEGVEWRRRGSAWIGCCPFHEERSGSFSAGREGENRGHCFGCGWSGDIIEFWQNRRQVDFSTAVEQLASLAGMSPRLEGVAWTQKAPKMPSAPKGGILKDKPDLPELKKLGDWEVKELAQLRGLSVQGVRLASKVGCLFMSDWPQSYKQGVWRPFNQAVPSWVVTDDARRVAQFRRFDGGQYELHGDEFIKAWTKGSPSWPLGCEMVELCKLVVLVEGGADMLAAYHFIHQYNMVGRVSVVAMLGSSNRIADAALGYFARARVRIIMDADKLQVKEYRRHDGSTVVRKTKPGLDAALRWSEQLREAGATVKAFNLEGLITASGEAVTDLNDVAKMTDADQAEAGIRDAFRSWARGWGD